MPIKFHILLCLWATGAVAAKGLVLAAAAAAAVRGMPLLGLKWGVDSISTEWEFQWRSETIIMLFACFVIL